MDQFTPEMMTSLKNRALRIDISIPEFQGSENFSDKEINEMRIGMLWFDNDPRADLDTKLKRATSYYAKKYGQFPNLCFIHPSIQPKEGWEPPKGIEVRANRSVLPNHFWIGVADDPTQ